MFGNSDETIDPQRIREKIEDYTGLPWVSEVKKEDKLVIKRPPRYRYEVEREGDKSWELRIFDKNESEEEPKWSVTPVSTDELEETIESFTPQDVRRAYYSSPPDRE